RPGATNGDLRDRHQLRADLRRERVLASRVLVVASREAQLEHVNHRRVDLEEARLHVAAARGADRVDRQVARVLVAADGGVGARGINRLVAIGTADSQLQRTTRELEQLLGHGCLDLPEIRGRDGRIERADVVPDRFGRRSRIEEVELTAGNRIRDTLRNVVVVLVTGELAFRSREAGGVEEAVPDFTLGPENPAQDAGIGLDRAAARRAEVGASLLAVGSERVVRVENAVGLVAARVLAAWRSNA